jgi:RHS repeat-associated protein
MKIDAWGPTRAYVYDIFGKLVGEYSSQSPGSTPPCSTCYLSTDHLGNTRLVTDANHNVIARHDYTPFGEEIPAGYAGRGSEWGKYDAVNQKFTGQEHDQETQLDFFQARYFSSAQGRYTSPDGPLLDQTPTDPQSWNLYSYVRNNPLNATDPSGNCKKDGTDGNGQFCFDVTGTATQSTGVGGGGGVNIGGSGPPKGDADPGPRFSFGALVPHDNTNAVALAGVGVLTMGCIAAEPCGAGELILAGLLLALSNQTIAYQPPPQKLPAFPDAVRVRPKAGRARWIGDKGKIIEWDSRHGKVEVFNKTGQKHLGEYDPNTGEQTKPPKPGRTTAKN